MTDFAEANPGVGGVKFAGELDGDGEFWPYAIVALTGNVPIEDATDKRMPVKLAEDSVGLATAANQSSVIGSGTGGTAATNSMLFGGKYLSSAPTLTTGQQCALQLTSAGLLKVSIQDGGGVSQGSTTAGQLGSLILGAVTTSAPSYTTAQSSPISLTTAGAVRVDNSAINQPIIGPTAADAALTVAPVTIGGRAATANPTAVADGDVVNAMFDKLGKQVVIGIPRVLKASQKTSLSNTTSETTIVTAGGSGVFNDLYGLVLANTGVTATKVDIRDDTGGSIIATLYVEAGTTRGFMLPVDGGLSQTTANKNWTAQCASATTAMEVTALFAKNI